MSGAESIIIYTTGTLLISVTAAKFLLQELISLVLLFRQLKVTIKGEVPSTLPEEKNAPKQLPLPLLPEIRSRSKSV